MEQTKGNWQGGFIIRPNAASIMCAYYADGSTMDKRCCGGRTCSGAWGGGPAGAECVPGCPTGHAPSFWCAELSDFGCAWRAGQLSNIFKQGAAVAQSKGLWPPEYNEIVLDPAVFVRALPRAIEAYYVRANADAGSVSRVAAVHQGFLERYGLSREEVPLLRYSPLSVHEAFSEVT